MALSELAPAWRDFLVRLPAVLASGGLAAVLFLLVAQCRDHRLGWIAAGVSLPSAFLWHHGQECRMYTLGALLVSWQALLAIRAIERPAGVRVWFALLIASVSAGLTHWFALSMWLPLLSYCACVRPTRRAIICTAVVFVITVAVLSGYIFAQFGGLEIVQTLSRSADTGSGVDSAIEAGRGSATADWWAARLRRLASASWCLWAIIGVGAPIIAIGGKYYPRYAFVALPALLLLVSLAIREANTPWLRAAIVVPCLAVQLSATWNQLHEPARRNPDFRGLARALQNAQDSQGRVACSGFIARLLSLYGAADAVGFSYTRRTFRESELQSWLSARVVGDRDAVVIVNPRWQRRRLVDLERLEAQFLLVDLRSWSEVEERRYRRKP